MRRFFSNVICPGLLILGLGAATTIEVTPDGVIWDGHHAVRIAAENGMSITVKVVNAKVHPTASSIMDLPVS